MSRKHFSILAGAVIVVVVAISLLTPSRTGEDSSTTEQRLLPGLEARINDARGVTVTVAPGERVVTLVRSEAGWTITELGGYPADFEVVRDVLAALAQAGVLEEKTANAAYFDRLGVQDLEAPDAPGTLVSLQFGEEDEVRVLVGKMASGRNGRYARVPESGPALLVDFEANLPRDPKGWADDTIANLTADEVARVTIEHADGETLSVGKATADAADFKLDQLPEGREVQSSWTLNSLAGVLTNLQFEAVRPLAEIDWTDPLVVRVLAFSGLEVTAQAVIRDDERWVRLSAAAPFSASPDSEPAAADEPEGEAAQADTAGAEDAVNALNERVSGWAYRIAPYKYDAMNKRLADLLKPLETGGAEVDGG